MTAIPRELRGGYTGFWRAADVLEFTSHGYDGYVFDENNQRIDFKGYRVDCITDLALEFFDRYDGKKPFFMTVSHIEPHHQNDHRHYEGPIGSKEKYADYEAPGDLAALGGNYREEYPDYLGQCASLDENLGRMVRKLKEKGLYEDTVILFVSDHGSHFLTRNRDAHLNGYDDYKRSMHDACLRVPLVISGGEYAGGHVVMDLVSTASLPKTILAIAGVDVGDQMIGENLADVVHRRNPRRPNEDLREPGGPGDPHPGLCLFRIRPGNQRRCPGGGRDVCRRLSLRPAEGSLGAEQPGIGSGIRPGEAGASEETAEMDLESGEGYPCHCGRLNISGIKDAPERMRRDNRCGRWVSWPAPWAPSAASAEAFWTETVTNTWATGRWRSCSWDGCAGL